MHPGALDGSGSAMHPGALDGYGSATHPSVLDMSERKMGIRAFSQLESVKNFKVFFKICFIIQNCKSIERSIAYNLKIQSYVF